MRSWIRDGERVEARYMGVLVTGLVESSRVKYGGLVQYTVKLDSPVQLRWRTEARDRVLIDEHEVL